MDKLGWMTAKKCEALKNEGKYVKLQTTYIHFIFRLIGQILKIWYFKFVKIKFKC